jgi:hypothetical protein
MFYSAQIVSNPSTRFHSPEMGCLQKDTKTIMVLKHLDTTAATRQEREREGLILTTDERMRR